MAQHRLGARGQLVTLRTMLSLEPATITGRFYPEVFQQGETAHGKPIVDGQHPHDLLMELGALYDLRPSENTLLSVYVAPVGDPAIGPTAYPHRQSASEDPIAALGHHQEDSTHIAFNVVTAGFTWKTLRLEGSGFHGAEPTEQRWGFQPSPNGLAVDSAVGAADVVAELRTSPRSIASRRSPVRRRLRQGENQRRQTASAMVEPELRRAAEDGGDGNAWRLARDAATGRRRWCGDRRGTKRRGTWRTAICWSRCCSSGGGTTSGHGSKSAARTNELLRICQLLMPEVDAWTCSGVHVWLRSRLPDWEASACGSGSAVYGVSLAGFAGSGLRSRSLWSGFVCSISSGGVTRTPPLFYVESIHDMGLRLGLRGLRAT